jgi:hypothetical protein
MDQAIADASPENSERNRGNVENIIPHQYKPGESGNPGGRPKKLPITDHMTEQLGRCIPETMRAKLPAGFADLYGEQACLAELIAFRLILEAAQGNLKALAAVLDRVEGKPTQGIGGSGKAEEPVVFRLVRCDL